MECGEPTEVTGHSSGLDSGEANGDCSGAKFEDSGIVTVTTEVDPGRGGAYSVSIQAPGMKGSISSASNSCDRKLWSRDSSEARQSIKLERRRRERKVEKVV